MNQLRRFVRVCPTLLCLGSALAPWTADAATYSAWSLQQLGTPAAAPSGDEDCDGTPTIWEYYLGRNPRVADGGFAPIASVETVGANTALTASLPPPTPGTDAKVEWQISPDLVTWTTVASSTSGAPFTGTGSQGVSGGLARFRDPSPAGAAARFGRWRISSPTAGPGTLGAKPVVNILRDDRVATLEMDYRVEHAWGQWWTIADNGRSDCGFKVTWWPDGASPTAMESMGGCGGCCGACGMPTDGAAVAKTLVTGNRRVQLQPLVNEGVYHVRVERVNALGEITSQPTELTFNGGDATRVDALRATMTAFDDFNLPEGSPDPKLWNNAHSTSTDGRFNLFFINAQFHAHTLNGTGDEHVGDKSQVAQRFRRPIAIENGVRRRIVFDMDSPLGPRSVWYLDLNPIQTELTGHADFFDEDGVKGLPAGVLRLRSQGQFFSVHRIGPDGATHQIANADLQDLGREMVTNVRRAFDVRVGTDGIQVFIDGRSIIDTTYGAYPLAAGTYDLLWSTIGYNTSKDDNLFFLQHWDNFGHDGPVIEPRTTHNYVTQIAGDDYQKSQRWNAQYPTFNVAIPHDVRPATAGATAEAWLAFTYQMGDYSGLNIENSDYVKVNGVNYPLPKPVNNTVPLNPELVDWGAPHPVRIKLGDITAGGSASPLVVGNNTFRFFADNAGILNLHVEVLYPAGSEPAYTPPAALHHFPMHSELKKLGPPARIQRIGTEDVGTWPPDLDDPANFLVNVSGRTQVAVLVGNECYAGWAPDLMLVPQSGAEQWSAGGTAGVAKVELFLRPHGGGPATSQRVAILTTNRGAPAPQVRHVFEIDTTQFTNGMYELFLEATAQDGTKSHPSYGGTAWRFGADWSGGYYPLNIQIQN